MKNFATILVFSLTAFVAASPARGDRAKAKAAAAVAAAAAGGAGVAAGAGATNGNSATGSGNTVPTATGGDVTRGSDTIVMKEVRGIPGNECLTFRNNGTTAFPKFTSTC